MKHEPHWDFIRQWGAALNTSAGFLIVAGRQLLTDYSLDLQNQLLYLNVSDTYNALPEKLLRAFHSVLAAPQLWHTTHILKVDDTGIFNWGITPGPHVSPD